MTRWDYRSFLRERQLAGSVANSHFRPGAVIWWSAQLHNDRLLFTSKETLTKIGTVVELRPKLTFNILSNFFMPGEA